MAKLDWEERAAAAGLPRAHWEEQARRARFAAAARPVSDLDGIFDALRDAEAFDRLAESARS